MTLPALVLVHGGAHAGDCWDLTVNEIHRLEPNLSVLAVDLPGRSGKAGDLRTLTIADWVDTCHGLMVSEPERLAQILVERCRLYSR